MTPSPSALERSLRLVAPLLAALPAGGVLAWCGDGDFAHRTLAVDDLGASRLAGRPLAELEAAGGATGALGDALRAALGGQSGQVLWCPEPGAPLTSVRLMPIEDGEEVVGAAAVVQPSGAAPDAGELLSRVERCEADLRHLAHVTSHDLSEPMRVMSGYASMLERRYGDQLDERGRRYIDGIMAGAGRLHELTEALLAYSRARSRPIAIESVDLNDVMAAARDQLAGALAERRVQLTCDELPTVPADFGRVTELLAELISNAIKFSPRPPRIHVGARDAGTTWEVTVRDEGIGIAPAQHERAFELLQCLNPREDHPGTGAGLTVARETVRAHGGSMRLESELGAGSVFAFTLPKPAPAAPEPGVLR